MSELNIFSSVDDTIICNTPTGDKIEVNIFEIEDMITTMYADDSTLSFRNNRREQLKYLSNLFKDRYGFPISTISMNAIISLKEEKMNTLKKSVFQSLELVDSTESNQGPQENLES